MSVLNVCTTDMDREMISRRYRNPSLYHRIIKSSSTTTDSYDNYSSYTSTSTSSSFEVLFTRLIDVLIFTSAIAITAYSYLTGTLIQPLVEGPKPTVLVGYSSQHQKRDILIVKAVIAAVAVVNFVIIIITIINYSSFMTLLKTPREGELKNGQNNKSCLYNIINNKNLTVLYQHQRKDLLLPQV